MTRAWRSRPPWTVSNLGRSRRGHKLCWFVDKLQLVHRLPNRRNFPHPGTTDWRGELDPERYRRRPIDRSYFPNMTSARPSQDADGFAYVLGVLWRVRGPGARALGRREKGMISRERLCLCLAHYFATPHLDMVRA
jgi:hypothetical protein